MCQRGANYSTWRANMPKACQLFNLACQGYQFFNLGCQVFKFLEYLGNFKEKPYHPKIFNFVFNGERGII